MSRSHGLDGRAPVRIGGLLIPETPRYKYLGLHQVVEADVYGLHGAGPMRELRRKVATVHRMANQSGIAGADPMVGRRLLLSYWTPMVMHAVGVWSGVKGRGRVERRRVVTWAYHKVLRVILGADSHVPTAALYLAAGVRSGDAAARDARVQLMARIMERRPGLSAHRAVLDLAMRAPGVLRGASETRRRRQVGSQWAATVLDDLELLLGDPVRVFGDSWRATPCDGPDGLWTVGLGRDLRGRGDEHEKERLWDEYEGHRSAWEPVRAAATGPRRPPLEPWPLFRANRDASTKWRARSLGGLRSLLGYAAYRVVRDAGWECPLCAGADRASLAHLALVCRGQDGGDLGRQLVDQRAEVRRLARALHGDAASRTWDVATAQAAAHPRPVGRPADARDFWLAVVLGVRCQDDALPGWGAEWPTQATPAGRRDARWPLHRAAGRLLTLVGAAASEAVGRRRR